MHSLSPEMWERLDRLRAGGAYDARVPRRLGQRPGLPDRRRRPAGAPAPGGRVEGHRARPGRRGGAHRPAGRPRLPGQLQVPLEDPLQRLADQRLRLAPLRRAGPGGRAAREELARRRRLVRRSGAGRVPGALRGRPPRRACGPSRRRGVPAASAAREPERLRPASRRPWRCRASAPPTSRRRPSVGRQSRGRRGAARCCTICHPAPSTSPCRNARRWALAPPGLAARRQGPLRRAVGRGGPGVGAPLGGGHGRAGRYRRGHALAPPAHRQRALLRAGLLGGPLAAAAHRHLVGLAPAVPADLHLHGGPTGRPAPGGLGGRRARPDLPRGALRWWGTSRCAGATAVSVGSPRPRAISTRRTTSSRGISPSNERASTRRPSRPPCASRARLAAGRAAALRALRPRHGAPGVGRSVDPLHLLGAADATPTTRAAPSSSASTRAMPRATATPSSSHRGRARRPGIGSIGLWLQEIESGRASIGYWLVADARGQGLAASRPAGRRRRSRSASCPSRACTSSSSPGTWPRPGRPRPPASAARRRCGAGNASTASSTMPTASPSCTPSGPHRAEAHPGAASARLPRCSGTTTRTRRSPSASTT